MMDDKNKSLPEQYFNDVYLHNDDPWKFETSAYELNKYKATVEMLPAANYDYAFEIGCSIGVLTQMLTAKCSKLLSVDAAEAPLIKARERLKDYPQVTIQKMAVPDQFPSQKFDLILVSEVAYYFAMPDLQKLQQLIIEHLETSGNLLLVHWTPKVHDYPLTGDEVHDSFIEICGQGKPLTHLANQSADTYRMDLFKKN